MTVLGLAFAAALWLWVLAIRHEHRQERARRRLEDEKLARIRMGEPATRVCGIRRRGHLVSIDGGKAGDTHVPSR